MAIDRLKYCELHMGILQARMNRAKIQMQVCATKLNLKNEDLDVKSEELKFENFNTEYARLDEELNAYEEKVLLATEL
jgi:hypothetical protein